MTDLERVSVSVIQFFHLFHQIDKMRIIYLKSGLKHSGRHEVGNEKMTAIMVQARNQF